jgi:hypothetical protein
MTPLKISGGGSIRRLLDVILYFRYMLMLNIDVSISKAS